MTGPCSATTTTSSPASHDPHHPRHPPTTSRRRKGGIDDEDLGSSSSWLQDRRLLLLGSSTTPSVRVAHGRTTQPSPGTAPPHHQSSRHRFPFVLICFNMYNEENQSRKRKTTKKATSNRKKPHLPPKAKPSGSGSGKSNRKSSHVWKHFEKLPKVNPKDPNEAAKCMCIYCGNEFNCATSNGTSHLNNHFRKNCKQSPFRNDEDKQKAYGGYEQLQQPSSVPASQGEDITSVDTTTTFSSNSYSFLSDDMHVEFLQERIEQYGEIVLPLTAPPLLLQRLPLHQCRDLFVFFKIVHLTATTGQDARLLVRETLRISAGLASTLPDVSPSSLPSVAGHRQTNRKLGLVEDEFSLQLEIDLLRGTRWPPMASCLPLSFSHLVVATAVNQQPCPSPALPNNCSGLGETIRRGDCAEATQRYISSPSGITLPTRAALLQGMSPSVFVVYRQAIATLVIAPLAYFTRKKSGGSSMGLRNFSLIFLVSLIGVAIKENIYFQGLLLSSSSMASAMANLVPAITFLIASIFGMNLIGNGLDDCLSTS
ncbi:hypothetical protein F8388_019677 [Cannabis sativa]|uniref:BED-type domain-containing protein n=1 Tax=Cannabis sativa TaxID=3483 RepID=A0A7J6FGQ0_CANSA|nr:hypothetical protein F8388_019677 [Cannabis sativa]